MGKQRRGMVESVDGKHAVGRYAVKQQRLPNVMSWVTVQLTTPAGTAVAESSNYVRLRERWYPQKAAVEPGVTEPPCTG